MRPLFLLLFGFYLVAVPTAQAASLAAGPMSGPTAMREATVWIQAKSAGRAQLEFWPENAVARKRRSAPVTLSRREDYAARLPLAGLEPGVRYRYRVLVDGKPASAIHTLATQALWQWRSDPPSFKVLLGSCAYINEAAYDRPGTPYGGGSEIFASMAAAQPDLTLWLGDNVYFREADDSPSGMAARYRHDRALPALQALLGSGNHAAIWDDHDYGPNDSNASFIFKDQSLALFKRYWANPSYGLPGLPGIFTSVRHGDAEFFLLDDRWYRDADSLKAEDKAMFGKKQMRWLQNALLNSTATFKFIAGGSQLLGTPSPYEGWFNFPAERRAFIDWLGANRVEGVLFLSGDRHHTELLQWPRPDAYPLYDLTCSPLTAGTHDVSRERDNPRLVPGTLVGGRNYCSLEFSGPRAGRKLILRAFDTRGEKLWEKEIMRSEIAYPKPEKS